MALYAWAQVISKPTRRVRDTNTTEEQENTTACDDVTPPDELNIISQSELYPATNKILIFPFLQPGPEYFRPAEEAVNLYLPTFSNKICQHPLISFHHESSTSTYQYCRIPSLTILTLVGSSSTEWGWLPLSYGFFPKFGPPERWNLPSNATANCRIVLSGHFSEKKNQSNKQTNTTGPTLE